MRDEKAASKEPRASRPQWLLPAGIALLVGAAGLLAYLLHRGRARPREPVSVAPSAAPAAPVTRPQAPQRSFLPPPTATGPGGRHRHKRGYQKMLDGYLESTRYPPTSRPIAELENYRAPEAPPPAVRSNDLPGGRTINQREHQNMYYVAEGESATVKVELIVDGKPVTDGQPGGASLSKLEGKPRVQSASIASTTLKDDGAPPDERANDGTLTALVPFPTDVLKGFVGDLTLSANLRAGETLLTSTFGFLYTGHPPARFTGQVRETIEDGSLVLRMGIEVERAAEYALRARLYDSDGKAAVFMIADGELEGGRGEVSFVAFGKLLRDASLKSPYALRDVEAYVVQADAYPDRLKVPTWPGPFVTRRYSLEDFSNKEWASAEKQARLDEIQRLIEAAPE